MLFAWWWNYISDSEIECIIKFNQWKQRSYALWGAVLQATPFIFSIDGYYFIFMTYRQGNQHINLYKKRCKECIQIVQISILNFEAPHRFTIITCQIFLASMFACRFVCLSVSLSVLSGMTHERLDIWSRKLVHRCNGSAVPVCNIDK